MLIVYQCFCKGVYLCTYAHIDRQVGRERGREGGGHHARCCQGSWPVYPSVHHSRLATITCTLPRYIVPQLTPISGGTKRATYVNMPLLRLQSPEGKFTMSHEIEPARRSLCRPYNYTPVEPCMPYTPPIYAYSYAPPPCTWPPRPVTRACP